MRKVDVLFDLRRSVRVMLLILGAGLSAGVLADEPGDKTLKARRKEIEVLAERYSSARSDKARLEVLIRAVDLELIGVNTSVRVIDRIFRTKLMEDAKRLRGVETRSDRVELGERVESDDSTVVAPYFTGWKLFVVFDRSGMIQRYSLSKESRP